MIDTIGELKLHSSRMTWLKISFQVVQGPRGSSERYASRSIICWIGGTS